MLDLDKIPQHSPSAFTQRSSRREFIRGALMAVSAGALWVFQRPALVRATTGEANGGAHNIWGTCSGLGSWVWDDDCNGCQQGRVYGGCNSNGWHRHDHSIGLDWRTDACKDHEVTGEPYYDGWKWKPSNCCVVGAGNCRKNREWRCHDGWINGKASICRFVTASGTACTPCPT